MKELYFDYDSFDWGGEKLSKREKDFILYYSLPGQDGFLAPIIAARKAGYKESTCKDAVTRIKKDKKIKKVIENILESYSKSSIRNAFYKAISEKIKRATYNIKDYYTDKVIFNPETGESINTIVAIPMKDIPKDKLSVIDNVVFSSNGMISYKLPNREKEITDILKLNDLLNNDSKNDEYNVETSIELIREQMENVSKIRIRNELIRRDIENSGSYIETDKRLPEYD